MAENSKSNSMLYFIIGALVVAVLGMGIYMMQSANNEPDLSIKVSEDGIDIDGK